MNRVAPRKQKTRRSGRANDTHKPRTNDITKRRASTVSLSIPRIADEVRKTQSFARDLGGNLYWYERRFGVYRPDGDKAIKRAVIRVLSCSRALDSWQSRIANEVTEYIAAICPPLWEKPLASTLNVRNGLLDLATLKLRPHSAKHLSPVQLPVNFDPTAKCPAWDAFVDSTFPSDSRHVAYEIVALTMVPDYSQQYAVLLTGEGGNGRSTLLDAVAAFVGSENVSALSLHAIEQERFARAQLYGMLANICPDIPSHRLATTATFKALTGGDHITAEHKFRDPFKFRSFARLIFSCNRPFSSNDDSAGFHDRWRVIQFDRLFRGTKYETPRELLDARLADPRELSGVLNKALAALANIRRRGLDITPSMKQAAARFHRTADPFSAWINSNTLTDPHASVLKRKLLDAYNRDAVRDGRTVMSAKAFGDRLHRLDISSAQRRVKGKRQWFYSGLRYLDARKAAPVTRVTRSFPPTRARRGRSQRGRKNNGRNRVIRVTGSPRKAR